MNEGLDHLTDHVADAPEVSSLEQISEYGKQLVIKRDELTKLEVQVKEKKKEITKLEQELLPEALISVGLSSISLSDGNTISISEEISCSVADYELLEKFLEEQGDDALLKSTLEVGKLPNNIMNMILRELKNTYDIDAVNKTYIHPATLKAYFKRLCGIGTNAEAKVPLAEINEDMINTYTYYKVAIKADK